MTPEGCCSPPNTDRGVVVEVREKKGPLRAAIPTMPFPLAVICLFLNTFIPGLGESASAFGPSLSVGVCPDPTEKRRVRTSADSPRRTQGAVLRQKPDQEAEPRGQARWVWVSGAQQNQRVLPQNQVPDPGSGSGVVVAAERSRQTVKTLAPDAEMRVILRKRKPVPGTLISAFTVLCGAQSELIPERGVCCVFWLNVAAAMIQILTAVIMVGWIMSIFWGMDMVILASQFFFIPFSLRILSHSFPEF
ncbi:unnamed protein product [Tetraodon nigroviridis]|uniref:(spotted green pufferfish) hypothetical protein n=1 Tax=Tetraodon nigroviridis TaxID=99883 RepID=Q4SC36_TETNG|nr:unnamed protein product [Tetraodon nigroviridis]